MSKYDTWSKVDLRNACKAAGISYTNMTNATMRQALVAHYATDTQVETPAVPEVLEQRADDVPVVTTPPTDPAPAEVDPLGISAGLRAIQDSAPAVAAKPAKPKAPRAPKDQRGGVTRPSADGKCGQVWSACDALKEEGKELTFDALRLLVPAETSDATIRTQRQRHRKFHA